MPILRWALAVGVSVERGVVGGGNLGEEERTLMAARGGRSESGGWCCISHEFAKPVPRLPAAPDPIWSDPPPYLKPAGDPYPAVSETGSGNWPASAAFLHRSCIISFSSFSTPIPLLLGPPSPPFLPFLLPGPRRGGAAPRRPCSWGPGLAARRWWWWSAEEAAVIIEREKEERGSRPEVGSTAEKCELVLLYVDLAWGELKS
ncbi:integrase-type DNA-binding superfamily protein [Striga asiatica]|uniref:Integrase-type DNA-binding superfamily protein n=1 Tax=Striga asiatica TaxID=4170 RepID=A0A5A7R890_STRAF|nr:integrase-type DNA-binding superfamily protein [Striga asiatica]